MEKKLTKVLFDEEEFLGAHKEWYEKLKKSLSKVLGENRLVIVGIQRGGVMPAKWLKQMLEQDGYKKIGYGELDISLYRDDFSERFPSPLAGSHLIEPIERKVVLLVDDVLFTGRTIRSALSEVMDYGRPERIMLAVQVDRGHRELPIQADFSVFSIETNKEDHVRVSMAEEESKFEGRIELWK